MIETLKNIGRAIIPKSIFKALQPYYHGAMALVASIAYGRPSNDLFVIGVTGTAGKSTTVMMLAHILNHVGKKAGFITTVSTSDGNHTVMNKKGLSMPGGWVIQKNLHHFVMTGCKYAVIEASSEALAQNRHLGINFRMALFTNLSPAHLDAHGTFENYRAAKGRLFTSLSADSYLGVNVDDPNYQYFSNFPARKKFGTSAREDRLAQVEFPVTRANNIKVTENLNFEIEGQSFSVPLKGSFNINNALLAVSAAQYLGVSLADSAEALAHFGNVPGRMEVIPNNLGLTIIVDYAPEPAGMEQSLRSALMLDHKRLIHVFGSTGGHRDVAKRFEFGKISGKLSDYIIITNDDVYDSDPNEIAKNIQTGIDELGDNKKVQQVEIILDRKQALQKALSIIQPGDLLLITGKGSEQFLVLPNNQRIDWDDRKIVKELLSQL